MTATQSHDRHHYSSQHLLEVLRSVKTVAMIGASPREDRASNRVLKFMHDKGYDMIPVNPRPSLTQIHGLKVYESLASIDRPVDMVQVFRRSDALYGIAEQAIAIGAKVLWSQLDVYDENAAKLAEEAGLTVVMNRCPKIELARAA